MGSYYYNHARYDEAIEQFEYAIDGMPQALFIVEPAQSIGASTICA